MIEFNAARYLAQPVPSHETVLSVSSASNIQVKNEITWVTTERATPTERSYQASTQMHLSIGLLRLVLTAGQQMRLLLSG